jgi:5-formyltetrahydrofolate cyclo-ligase
MLQRVWLGVNMNIEEKIKRINELYHKSQAEGLTEEERAEQAALRAEYVANVRANLRGQLDNISIKEKDGSITNLGEQRARRTDERKIE